MRLPIFISMFPVAAASIAAAEVETIGAGLTFIRGPVNGARIERAGKTLAAYGDPRDDPAPVDMVLFTHTRRDVVWAGAPLIRKGARAVVPAAEASLFGDPGAFWSGFQTKRFHDYAQVTSKVLAAALPASRSVRGGETIDWEGAEIRVLDTPGYTRGSITYLVRIDGKLIAFTGDLIYGDGRLLDLYSLQDAIPEAKIGGYHGHAARLADVVKSLEKLAVEKPDLIVPARGPLIGDPAAAIERLRSRIQAMYRNYLSIDALRWYFKDEHILAKARRVLGPEAKVEWMEMAEERKLPGWAIPISNSRLILAQDGSGFLSDCGGKDIVDELKRLRAAGTLKSLDHIFISHYHDDHTDSVAALAAEFGSTVQVCGPLAEVVEDPQAYRLPCMTTHPILVSGRLHDRATFRWKEFEMTAYDFPGQTLFHDGLLVKRDGGESLFLVGDSFTPSGIDDYCLQNRNFLHAGRGYFRCLDILGSLPPETFLVNQHVEPTFRFSSAQIGRMKETLLKRRDLLAELLPWDDPNFGLDEGWARFYPYARSIRRGEEARFLIRIMNHSPSEQVFRARLNLPAGWAGKEPAPLRVLPREEGALEVKVMPGPEAATGLVILTADILWDRWELREWTEAMATVTQ
jgi:glyoxylase-like metal-dependent hydrolase (beta-lactamase superfamily II)